MLAQQTFVTYVADQTRRQRVTQTWFACTCAADGSMSGKVGSGTQLSTSHDFHLGLCLGINAGAAA